MSATADVLIAGAGAAGLMCASVIENNFIIIDKNGFGGKKLNITGKGRCNVTNDCTWDEFEANVCSDARFLRSSFTAFPPRKVMKYFENLGLKLKVERGRRVFPASDRARDITDALAFGKKVTRATARELIVEDGKILGIRTNDGDFFAKKVIIAVGGKSYPGTGSDGGGYALAAQAGHKIIKPRPGLVGLISPDALCAELAGLTLKNVTANGSEIGELLFTHTGVSGPLILTLSSRYDFENGGELSVDLKPALSHAELDARLLRDLGASPNKNLDNALEKLLPKSLLPYVLRDLGRIKAHDLTKARRMELTDRLKNFAVKISGTEGFDQAVITRGGVDTREINPKTMESRLVSGLYFAGEVLDCDALTGGYNLQIAWQTARAAALAG